MRAAAPDERAAVVQLPDAGPDQLLAHQRGTDIVIVIAEHSDDGRSRARHVRRENFRFAAFAVVRKVAAEQNHLRRFTHLSEERAIGLRHAFVDVEIADGCNTHASTRSDRDVLQCLCR